MFRTTHRSKTIIAASGITYVFGWLSHRSGWQPKTSFWTPDDKRCVVRNMLSN